MPRSDEGCHLQFGAFAKQFNGCKDPLHIETFVWAFPASAVIGQECAADEVESLCAASEARRPNLSGKPLGHVKGGGNASLDRCASADEEHGARAKIESH